jgi:uncharacterized protein YjbI with pentapeptide repeats
MANAEHLNILKQGVDVWNNWIGKLHGETVDLSGADLSYLILEQINFMRVNLKGVNFTQTELRGARLNDADLSESVLSGANFSNCHLNGANLSQAELTETRLSHANLSGAHLSEAVLTRAVLTHAILYKAIMHNTFLEGADLSRTISHKVDLKGADLNNAFLFQADFSEANLTDANLTRAILSRAILNKANLTGADLTEADLKEASLVKTIITKANLSGCSIFGISAWKLKTEDTIQSNLIISDKDEPTITVDSLEVAQFIYLLLHNEKLRDVIDTVGKKAVLILGRFTSERKAVLEAIRDELRIRNYIPIMFDFERPYKGNFIETITLLAHLSLFVIADITDAKAVQVELDRIVPTMPSVPVQPIILASEKEYGLFEDLGSYHWLLEIYRYRSVEHLITNLLEHVIKPAEKKVIELRTRKR